MNDFELSKESLEYDSDLDSDQKKCMECPEVAMDWSDLSNPHKESLYWDVSQLVFFLLPKSNPEWGCSKLLPAFDLIMSALLKYTRRQLCV